MKWFSDRQKIIFLFLIWRIFLFIVALFSIFFIKDFGDRFPYYKELLIPTGLPSWIWGFGNFDGVHYLTIAINGYASQYTQVFFPIYPILINLVTKTILTNAPLNYFISGMLISNLSFLTGLFFFYKLVLQNSPKDIALKSILLILAIPTSFYFGAIYTESLFFLLVVITFLLIRKGKFLYAGIFAALASATKILGIILFFILIYEFLKSLKDKKFKIRSWYFFTGIFGILVSGFGLFYYMLYLNGYFNDPLYFLTAQPVFGASRSSQPLVLLPQVFFRYIKIFLTNSFFTLSFFNAFLEFIFACISLALLIFSFRKVRFSYWLFTFFCLIIPTLTGTFSSMPRYFLMSFLLLPFIAEKLSKYLKFIIIISIIIQAILLSLFIRGYWVA